MLLFFASVAKHSSVSLIYIKKQSSLLRIFSFLQVITVNTRCGQEGNLMAVPFASKHSKFSLLSVNPVEIHRRDVPLLDRDNVGLVVALATQDSSAASPAICVANTPLLYNQRAR